MNDSLPRDAVDQAVADHYAQVRLDAATLGQLRDQIRAASPHDDGGPVEPLHADTPERTGPDREPVRAVRLRTRWTAGVAALAVFAVALLAWPQPAVTGEAMAREIASDHVMALSPDVEATSFDEVRDRLAKLDFAAVRPSAEAMPSFRLTGARYARVGGEMGAQLQIEDPAGRPCSLFQVRDDETFRNVRDAVYEVGGVRVRVWREAGLLMGLAETVG